MGDYANLQERQIMLNEPDIMYAEEIGKEWGRLEVENWKDQNPEKPLPEWTYGTYCGPRIDGFTDEEWKEFEDLIEESAKKVWDEQC